jgi:hypothetical protein
MACTTTPTAVTEQYDFAIDGKEYPTPADGMESWTAAGENAWESVFKRHGKELSRTRHEISSDGKTLTDTSTGTKPDGSALNNKTVYTRLSGSTGLEGKWKSTKVNISAPNTWVISVPSTGTMRWEIAEYKETVEGKTDGTDLAIEGPTAPEGFTLAIKSLSPNKLSYTVKLKGKPFGIAEMSLSADGKTMTHINWSPGKESEKTTGVYLKQ